MFIKFVATKKVPTWKGRGGLWRDGDIQEFEDADAIRLLGLYESPFVEAKSIKPKADKMIHSAPETKMSVEDKGKSGKPKGDNLKKKFSGWGKNKGKK